MEMISRATKQLATVLDKLGDPWVASVRMRDSHLVSTRSEISAFLGHISAAFDTVTLDLSAADLSNIYTREVDPFINVIWSPRTIWPLKLIEQVRARSRTICVDVFQVTAG